MEQCDCCGKEIRLHYDSFTRVLGGVYFNTCSDCAQNLSILCEDPVSEETTQRIRNWAAELLARETVAKQKEAAFRKAVFSDRQISSGRTERVQSGNTIHNASRNRLFDIDNGSGSGWTTVSKIGCFFLVFGLMAGGGVLGSFVSYNSDDTGVVLLGVMIGLIVGLVVVSGHMMLIDMVDNIADSKQYLKSIRRIMDDHFSLQESEDRLGQGIPMQVRTSSWICSCGSEQPLTNSYCGCCGRKRTTGHDMS